LIASKRSVTGFLFHRQLAHIDDRNRRFSPVSHSSLPPFEVELNPSQSVNTALIFNVPADAKNLVLAVG
jgi:hypothetical protein